MRDARSIYRGSGNRYVHLCTVADVRGPAAKRNGSTPVPGMRNYGRVFASDCEEARNVSAEPGALKLMSRPLAFPLTV
jgi:hypothetical protein